MTIKFYWAKNLNLDTNKEFETNIEEWLTSGYGPKQCRDGIVHIFCDSTDELSHTIKGRISCQKGDTFFPFVSSLNGGTITLV